MNWQEWAERAVESPRDLTFSYRPFGHWPWTCTTRRGGRSAFTAVGRTADEAAEGAIARRKVPTITQAEDDALAAACHERSAHASAVAARQEQGR